MALWSARMLDLPHERVNARGGAVALGHPIGATGARLDGDADPCPPRSRGGGIGAVSLCGGGGQGDAMIVKVG